MKRKEFAEHFDLYETFIKVHCVFHLFVFISLRSMCFVRLITMFRTEVSTERIYCYRLLALSLSVRHLSNSKRRVHLLSDPDERGTRDNLQIISHISL